MNQLYKLVRKLSPTGVHFCSLEDVCRIETGKQINKGNLLSEGNYPVLNGGISPSGYWHDYNTDANTIAISQGGASAGYVNYITTPFWAGAHCYVVFLKTKKVLYKFLYYFIKNNQEKLMNSKQGAGIPGLNRKAIYSLNIPLPPLPIQQEIVRILDTFTNLTAELTDKLNAELTARRKQYEYYRDELLTFGEDVPKVSLSELARFTYGFTDKAKETGDTRFIRITDIDDNGNLRRSDAKYITLTEESRKYLLKKGDILLARTGATYGKTLYIPDDTPAVFASFLIKIELDNSRILNRYYWHFAKSTQYWTQAEKYVSKAGQQQFNSKAVGRVLVPIPPLGVQQKIVDILDKFDKLCADIGDGLPAEIEARQRQYGYYRGQLLKFDN